MIGKTNACIITATPTTGDYKVTFIDPFGVISEQWVNDGEDAVVPTPKVYDNLTFTEWNQDTTNITSDKIIGATYSTTDGKTYVKIRLTTVSGLSPTLYLNKSDGSTLTVDWGDGTTSTFTNSGNFNTGAHNYSAVGDYVITMWISSGSGTYMIGDATNSFCNLLNSIKELYIGTKVNKINDNSLTNNKSIRALIIPTTLTLIGNAIMDYCFSFDFLVYPNGILNFNASRRRDNYSLSIVSTGVNYQSVAQYEFYNNYSLGNFQFSKECKTIGDRAFTNCYRLKKVILFDKVTSIGWQAFYNCYGVEMYKIYATTPPTLGTDVFYAINSICKIYVPDASLTAYKTATNWVTYADYIYPLSDIGE